MLSTIKDIFERNNEDILDKNRWVTVTNHLINEIEYDRYCILKYKEEYNNQEIVENVIRHNGLHSHSVIYINPKYKLQKIVSNKLIIESLYPKCISSVWKSSLLTTSHFEDKLFYIMSFILDNITELEYNENIVNWVEMIYYMKKKSVNDIIQKLIWEIYYQVFDIVEPLFVDVSVIYFNSKDWEKNKEYILGKFHILSDKIKISNVSIIARDERQIIELDKKKR